MDSFEWNKVFAAVIASALLIMVITTISENLFHEEEGVKPAFTIEVAEAGGEAEATPEEAGPSLAELLATADVAKGERQFAKCKSCHTVEKGGANGTGPNLYGVIGRAVASHEGAKYSSALQEVGGSWTYELIDHWLANPKSVAKGTTMGFAGIRKDDQRADLIAYLASMADTHVPFPAVEASAAPEAEAPADDASSGR
ncbi:c-type cytochrome [Kordiimonas pumila]|uniref:C-type cytochrome n=1 Tax=Kordiimonas pumila TaxID=2161677 RepID=A0ABV7D5S7_9PROT|nr:cytochrome c family protein [Kordiimonas pumila]